MGAGRRRSFASTGAADCASSAISGWGSRRKLPIRNHHVCHPAGRNRSASIDDNDGRVVSGLLASPGMDRLATISGVVIMFWMLWYFLAGRDR